MLRLILRQGIVLTLIGVGIGLAAGALVSQVLRSLLFGVSALDPLTFGGAPPCSSPSRWPPAISRRAAPPVWTPWSRCARSNHLIETAWQDVRYGFPPAPSQSAVHRDRGLSLAIGIGANTTIFSVASAVLLRPLPGLTDPGRLVDVGRTTDGNDFDTATYPNYKDLRAADHDAVGTVCLPGRTAADQPVGWA